MISLTVSEDGILLPVRAQGGARQDEIRGVQDGALKVAVTQVPEKGKANKAIHSFLAKSLGLRRSQVSLASGHTSRRKVFLVTEISEEELRTCIENNLEGLD